MSDGVKIQGLDDLERLKAKLNTWTPPPSLDEFLALVRKVISSSKYTDSYCDGDLSTLQNLRTFVRVKANRVYMHPDLEECVDVAAYAFMVYDILMEQHKAEIPPEGAQP